MAQFITSLLLALAIVAASLAQTTTSSVSTTPSHISAQACADLNGYQSRTTKQCFFHVNETKSFIQAELHCNTKFGGHLASVHNGFDNLLITDFARTDFATIDQFYIGLNALDGSGKYTWLDGTDVDYTNWGYNTYNTQCVVVDMKTATWVRSDCFTEAYFVCSA
uniref:C-type lectin domain-containing protein n=1 Tax=Panagrellus redivivus TaxID=6233 RepID=A0A7E4UTQ9_PANRE